MNEGAKKNIVLIQPQSGSYDHIVVDPPLGLVYAAAEAVKKGFEIRVIDCRIVDDWKRECLRAIDQETVLIGVSVMSGRPIYYAREISLFVKKHCAVPVLWGGAHPTLDPEHVLASTYVDYVCRGDGSQALAGLAEALSVNTSVAHIPNVCFKKDGTIMHNEMKKIEAVLPWRDIPFDLISSFSYHRFNAEEKIFPVLTSIGCPHQCRFCYLSAESMRQKWCAYTPEESVDFLQHIIDTFTVNYLSIIDNDFFVDLDRAREIFTRIVKKQWDVQIGFRGARIDELDRMDDAFLRLMVQAQTKHLHIGVESGSQRMLDYYRKGITVDQIVRVNKKIARFPELLPSYNFFGGAPTETVEDIQKSISLLHTLVKENPHCQISSFNQYVPYPGGDLSEEAERNGFVAPQTLEEWATFDDTKVAREKLPWLTRKHKQILFAAYAIGIFIDRKVPDHFVRTTCMHRIYRVGWRLFHGIAKMRVRYAWYSLPFEYFIMRGYYRCIEAVKMITQYRASF